MIIDGYERRIVRLEREVAEVREQLRRNSQNSSKPPSSDGPHVKRKPPKEPSGRKPGGQPGHPVHRRTLIPVEQYHLTLLAEGYRTAGQADEGLAAVAEALTWADKNDERFYEAELYRLKGMLTLQSQTSLGQVSDKSKQVQRY